MLSISTLWGIDDATTCTCQGEQGINLSGGALGSSIGFSCWSPLDEPVGQGSDADELQPKSNRVGTHGDPVIRESVGIGIGWQL